MQQPSRPISPASLAPNGSSKLPDGGEAVSPSIERLRAASLVKSPNKRVNAEPLSSSAANPWVSPRTVSPTSRTGISYATMVSRPSTPQALLALKKESARAATPTQHSESIKNDGPVAATPAPAQSEVIDADATAHEVVVKEEEDLELNALALRRTRSGKQLAVAKLKNKKQRSKKNAKVAGKMPATVGKGLPSSASLADVKTQTADPPQRSTSDVRKRRRVSTDVDGDTPTTGTTAHAQDAPTTTGPAQQSVYIVDIGEMMGFPPFEVSPAPDDDRTIPLAKPISEAGGRDFEMRDQTSRSDQGPTAQTSVGEYPGFTYARRTSDGSYSTQRIYPHNPEYSYTYLARTNALHEGNIEDMYEAGNMPMYGPPQEQAGPSRLSASNGPSQPQERERGDDTDRDMSRRMQDIEAASRASSALSRRPTHLSPAPAPAARAHRDFDEPQGPRRPRSPSILHPHPVHYAPGPFPNFPADPAEPVPAGPIQPLAPAPGASQPAAMTLCRLRVSRVEKRPEGIDGVG